MAPWLTFVIGIIVGVLIGWLIDLLYRRAPRPAAEEPAAQTPVWAQAPSAPSPAPELPGAAAAATIAVAAVSDDEALDVPPHSQTAETVGEAEAAGEVASWAEISEAVESVAEEVDAPPAPPAAPRIVSSLPDDSYGLPPVAADTLKPPPVPDDEAPEDRA